MANRPYKIPYDDLKIPEEITSEQNVSALSEFSEKAYGRRIDKRLSWKKALEQVNYARRKAVAQRNEEVQRAEQEIKDIIMYRSKWPWKEGYKFYVEGPRRDSHACYLKDMFSGLEFFCPADELASYLEDDFEIPSLEEIVVEAPPQKNAGKKKEKVAPPPADEKVEDSKPNLGAVAGAVVEEVVTDEDTSEASTEDAPAATTEEVTKEDSE